MEKPFSSESFEDHLKGTNQQYLEVCNRFYNDVKNYAIKKKLRVLNKQGMGSSHSVELEYPGDFDRSPNQWEPMKLKYVMYIGHRYKICYRTNNVGEKIIALENVPKKFVQTMGSSINLQFSKFEMPADFIFEDGQQNAPMCVFSLLGSCWDKCKTRQKFDVNYDDTYKKWKQYTSYLYARNYAGEPDDGNYQTIFETIVRPHLQNKYKWTD